MHCTHRRMSRILHHVTLHFRDRSFEKDYGCRRIALSGSSCAVLSAVLLFIFLSDLCVLPWSANRVYAFVVAELSVVLILLLMNATRCQRVFPGFIQTFAEKGEHTFRHQLMLAVAIVTFIGAANIATMVDCWLHTSMRNVTYQLEEVTLYCAFPSYVKKNLVLILLAISLLVQVTYIVKSWRGVTASKYKDCISLVAVALVVVYISRTADRMFRKLFYYQQEVTAMKTKIVRLRERNEALVFNILPSHVATHLIGKHNDDVACGITNDGDANCVRTKHELYSQTYDKVGVMFAACPNFNDFYTENPINNNGLECIRVLNEIISDYDDLLAEPRFSRITKIKSIGSTYMAASGMTADCAVNKDAPFADSWQHLSDLVEFAIALKGALAKINSQSFNNFMLRIGINHGPIIAGVIGARKPHYDIWGNTVNVASRMESTGQLNKIQVVGSTMDILLEFGYTFEQRGLVKVKGKGDIMTYFLTGRDGAASLPNQVSPF
ncbi:Adenylate cyclase type 3 [Lamellibrachia satsuma]|nr:Adenylate cyclase type 3 [Lamellibrachia satsuma]